MPTHLLFLRIKNPEKLFLLFRVNVADIGGYFATSKKDIFT